MLDTLFLACFGFGTSFAILAGALHLVGGTSELPALDALEGGWVVTKFASPTAILAGMIGFGGMGHVALGSLALGAPLALGAAGAAGLAIGIPTGMFVRRLRQDTGLLLEASVDGLPAVVTVAIPEGGVGEIQFERRGLRASEAARGARGQAFARGSEVAIVGYVDGVAEVASLGLEDEAEGLAALPAAKPEAQALPQGDPDPA